MDPDLLRLSFSFPYDKNRLSMTIPASVPVVLASHGFFPYIRTDTAGLPMRFYPRVLHGGDRSLSADSA